jgi:hypothetical protein
MTLALALFAGAAAGAPPGATAAGAPAPHPPVRDDHRDSAIYGWQLMTRGERDAFRARLQAARTPEERLELRMQNHAAMQERARERGVRLRPPPQLLKDEGSHGMAGGGDAAVR